MERRLLTVIINPAMIVTWAVGLWLVWEGGFANSGWLHAKLLLVHRDVGDARHVCRAGAAISPPTATGIRQKFYRIINEIPTVLMIGIVILVIVKPF